MQTVSNARKTDPITSHLVGYEMEAKGVAENQRLLALKAVKQYPRQTSMELSVLTGLNRYMLARRLPELKQLKQGEDRLRRYCTVTDKLSVIWEERGAHD